MHCIFWKYIRVKGNKGCTYSNTLGAALSVSQARGLNNWFHALSHIPSLGHSDPLVGQRPVQHVRGLASSL